MISLGYRVLRFWNTDVNSSLTNVLDTIYAALEERASPPAGRDRVRAAEPSEGQFRGP